MLNLLIGFIVFMFVAGMFDAFHTNYINSKDYQETYENYLSDLRRIEKM